MPASHARRLADDGVAEERDQGERERQAEAQVVDQRSRPAPGAAKTAASDFARMPARADELGTSLKSSPVEFDDDGRCRKRDEQDRERHARQHGAQPPHKNFTQVARRLPRRA